MKKVLNLFLVFVLLITFSSVLQAKKKTYLVEMKLHGVNRVMDMEKVEKTVVGDLFEDESIQVKWTPESKELKFELLNKTSGPIFMIWEESFFLDRNEAELRIIHSGIKPENMYKSAPPQDIPSNTRINDSVFPCDYLSQKTKLETQRGLDGAILSSVPVYEWIKKPLYEKKVSIKKSDDFDFTTYKEELLKETFGVLLTVKEGEKKYRYYFKFIPEVKEK